MSDLESIKSQVEWAKENGINPPSNVDSDDIDWLIEQAEKVEELEKERDYFEKLASELMELKKQKDEEIQRLETELMMIR
jgi:hypothetical protein